MKKIFLVLLMIAASLFAQDHPPSRVIYITGAGGGGVSPIDPSTLSPTNWFDENERANNSWGDKLSADAFGDGGATSYFPFTQNSLTFYETDGGFTPLFRNDATNWFTSDETSFSFVMVHKTTVAGSATGKRLFYQSSDDAQAFWEVRRWDNAYPYYRAIDDAAHSMFVSDTYALNDNVWYITIMTVKQETNAGELFVYQSTGVTLTDTDATWVLSKYNGGLSGTFLNGGGGQNSTWTGTAEIIFYDNKILTIDEANGIGLWLAAKWDVTWVENTP